MAREKRICDQLNPLNCTIVLKRAHQVFQFMEDRNEEDVVVDAMMARVPVGAVLSETLLQKFRLVKARRSVVSLPAQGFEDIVDGNLKGKVEAFASRAGKIRSQIEKRNRNNGWSFKRVTLNIIIKIFIFQPYREVQTAIYNLKYTLFLLIRTCYFFL